MLKKVALVTGAGAGMGAATCILLSSQGYRVAMLDLMPDHLHNTAKTCLEEGANASDILKLPCDIGHAAGVYDAVEETVTTFGQIDLLVNCAGVGCIGTGLTASLDDYFFQMNINLTAVVRICREVAKHLIKTKGNIVNICSAWNGKWHPNAAFYCMSKNTLALFTRCLANELSPYGVRVNAVNPGIIKTNIHDNNNQTKEEYAKELSTWMEFQSLKTQGTPADVAHAVEFLASDEARFITGFGLTVDGGLSSRDISGFLGYNIVP